MSIFQRLPGTINLRDIFLRIPDQALPLIDFYEAMLRGPSPLSAGEREAIYSYLSRQAGCHFCHTSHRHCAVALGIPAALFEVLPADLKDAPVRPELRRLLAFATDLMLGIPTVPPRGLPADMVRDTVRVVGLTAFINRVIDGLAAESPDEAHRRNGEGLARQGYAQVRVEVEKGFAAAGVTPAQALPDAAAPPGGDAIDKWLHDYSALVLDGPSGIPRTVRHALAQETARGVPLDAMPLWTFGHRLVAAPRRSTAADLAPILAAGWGERDVVDLVLASATTALRNRLLAGRQMVVA